MQVHRANERRSKKGAAIVELAVVLPVLLILLLGVIDAGQFAHTYQIISDASRESARMAARANTGDVSQVQTVARNYLANAFPSVPTVDLVAAVTVTVNNAEGIPIVGSLAGVAVGDPIQVEVSVDYDIVRLISGIAPLDNQTIQTTTIMCRQ